MAKKSGSGLISLFILIIVLCVAAAIGFVIYSIVQEVAKTTDQKMQKKNITLSRDGMKVGVKGISSEQYEDTAQNVLVKMWNNASFKSRFDGWGTTKVSGTGSPAGTPGANPGARKPFSRTSSSQKAK